MLTVKDLMTPFPTVVTPSTTLRRVVELMQSGGYRQLPVVDGGKLVGIITDRDVRLAVSLPMLTNQPSQLNPSLDEVTVGSCMTPNPITVSPDTPAYRAAEMLSLYKFGALVVVEDETVVGIITVTNFLRSVQSAPIRAVKYSF